MSVPRKIRRDLATPPEVAIRASLAAVEAMPADLRLTLAVAHLEEALVLVSDYVDEQMGAVTLGPSATMTPNRWQQVAENYGRSLRHHGHHDLGDSIEPCNDPTCCQQNK